MAPNGSANGAAFSLKQQPLDGSRPMKVRVIGAGYSGILAAIRSVARESIEGCFTRLSLNATCSIPERLRNIDLIVYEKNEGIGGVWYVQTQTIAAAPHADTGALAGG